MDDGSLPLNQVLYPGLVLSIQIVRKDSIALLQSVLRVSRCPCSPRPRARDSGELSC